MPERDEVWQVDFGITQKVRPALVIGRQREARGWLLARLPSAFIRKKFLETLADARERLKELPAQVRTDQSRIIHAPTYMND